MKPFLSLLMEGGFKTFDLGDLVLKDAFKPIETGALGFNKLYNTPKLKSLSSKREN
jgi:hypothetical protein